MIVFCGRSSGGTCGFVAWVSWETYGWMDHNYSGCMTMKKKNIYIYIYIDKNDNHDGHHCCKCCLMISWPDFRCGPSLCRASRTLNRDIKSADATWHRMTLAPRYCIWTKFALERNALRIPTLPLTWWAVILPGEGSYWLILIHATFEQQFFSTLPSLEWPDVLSLYFCIANFAWFGGSVW